MQVDILCIDECLLFHWRMLSLNVANCEKNLYWYQFFLDRNNRTLIFQISIFAWNIQIKPWHECTNELLQIWYREGGIR